MGGVAAGDVSIKVDLGEVTSLLRLIYGRMDDMATQADVDDLRTRLISMGDTLGAALNGLQQDLSDLQAQAAAGQNIDLSGVQQAVTDLGAKVQAATNLDAEFPPPPPA